MASKRSRPYDDPPSPESSEEEEEEEVDEEEEEEVHQTPPPKPKKPQSDENSDSDDEEEEEEESDDELKKNPDDTDNNTTKVSKLEPVPEPEPESEGGSDSDSEPEANYIAKPVVKELHPSKIKKAAKTAEEKVSKPTQKKQKGGASGGGEEEEDGGQKKGASSRVWNFDDEIAVLQGMIEFKKANGKDPSLSSDEFYNFVKPKFSNSKLTKSQVSDKIRRLKKKYGNYLEKLKNGVPLEFPSPHESKVYKLSCKIWGGNSENDDGEGGGGNSVNVGKSNGNSSSMVVTSPEKVKVIGLPVPEKENSVNHGKSGGVKSSKKSKNLDVDEEKKSSKKVKSSSSDAMEGSKKSKNLDVDEEKKSSKKVKSSSLDAMEVDEEKELAGVKLGEKGCDEELDLHLTKVEQKKGFDEKLYPHLMKALGGGQTVLKVSIHDGLKSCLKKVDSKLLEEWDKRWKEIHFAEMDAYVSKLALIHEQTSLFAKHMKSSKS